MGLALCRDVKLGVVTVSDERVRACARPKSCVQQSLWAGATEESYRDREFSVAIDFTTFSIAIEKSLLRLIP